MEIEEDNYYDDGGYTEDDMEDITEVFVFCCVLDVGRYVDHYQFFFQRKGTCESAVRFV